MVFTRPSAAGAGHNQEYWDAQRRRRRRKKDAERKRAKAEQQIAQQRAETTRRYGFSPKQAALFFFLEHYPRTQATQSAVAAVYGIKWGTSRPAKRRRYAHRLRTLIYDLNKKLGIADLFVGHPTPGEICLMFESDWQRIVNAKPSRRRNKNPVTPREIRQRCTQWIRHLLKDGPVLVAMLHAELERRGFEPSTIRAAKASAAARSFRVGFGGPWMVALTDAN